MPLSDSSRHEQSKCHQDAVQVVVILPKSCADIGKSLSTLVQHTQNRKLNESILQNVKFLARQGIALRGHNDAESNLMQLFKLRACTGQQSLVLGWSEMATNILESSDTERNA